MVLCPILLNRQHICEFETATHQVTDFRRRYKTGLDYIAREQIIDQFGILTVRFDAFVRFCIFRMCKSDPTGLFKDVKYKNSILAGRFNANFSTGEFRESVSLFF